MRHKIKKRTLGRYKEHRSAMLKNLAAALVEHKRIETTLTRAKEVSKLADKLVTWAKKGDLTSKRKVFQVIPNKDVAKELFDVVAPGYKEGANSRTSGYTRIIKLGFRKGDHASAAIIEFV